MSAKAEPLGVGAQEIGAQRIDVDVHPTLAVRLTAVLDYTPRAWREKLDYLGEIPLSGPPTLYTFLAGKWVVGQSGERPPESPSSAGVEALAREHLDAHGIGIGQLIATDAASYALQPRNYDLAAVLASAFNDFMLDQWLTDPRTRYALMVVPADAVSAAAEIRRHGGDSRISSVWLPPSATSLGDRALAPILEAALEHGLPILSHPGGPARALARPAWGFESRAAAPTRAWSGISSLVAHGVFERYRDLKVLFAESGFTWLPALLRRMDAAWVDSRDRLPELKRAPSEVVREHIRLASHPLDDDRAPAELARLIEDPAAGLSEMLVFSSNHPRAGAATATGAFADLAEDARRKIFTDNAKALLRI